MASIYLHIPFCKQACHYCDFHFSTSLKHKEALVDALCKELELRKTELPVQVENIYFGGGTPSLLSKQNLEQIFEHIYKNYKVVAHPEITLEANPDDITKEKLKAFKSCGINRLSLGIQSFFEEDLKLMNRAHNEEQAIQSLEEVKNHFENYSIDLIYGIPNMGFLRWEANLMKALEYDVPHLSCYALTVEPHTALEKFIEKEIIEPVDDELADTHFKFLYDLLTRKGYQHYEFSNFGKPGYFSQNNMAYWTGKPYLGIGPSAHSYNGSDLRTWTIKNNIKYIKSIGSNKLPISTETLTKTDRYNEHVMTRLRLQEGIDLDEILQKYGQSYFEYFMLQIQPHLDAERLDLYKNHVSVRPEAKFLSDGIAADLFKIEFDS